mgnify:CR=1 FL=1
MTIRERTQQIEQRMLSPYAALSEATRGRLRPEEECPIRTPYQRDRDRIIHCNAYRRLMHKTQVFLSPRGDHYRTRLTHTQEVSQIARTIARALLLNEDLTEAIALGHDLGHTPFGHAGEAVLNEVYSGGFSHNDQSVRVVQRLEKGGQGLNLTYEVLDGILHHSYTPQGGHACTLEGRVVHYADKIAYMNHDIDDAIRAGILAESDLPRTVTDVVGGSKSRRITSFVLSIVENSGEDIRMDPDCQAAYQGLRSFLFESVYTNPKAKGEEEKAKEVIRRLYAYFTAKPHKLPEDYQTIVKQEGADRAACDYISGMSDRYCVTVFESLFVPRSWGM